MDVGEFTTAGDQVRAELARVTDPAPAAAGDPLFVVIPSFDGGRHAHGPCLWQPAGRIPLVGDQCVVVRAIEDDGEGELTTVLQWSEKIPAPADFALEGRVSAVEGGVGQLAINAAQAPFNAAPGNTAAANATAIQAAIGACNAQGGGDVFVPAGTYACNALTIPGNSIAIRGSGREATILSYTGSGSFIANSNSATLRRRFKLNDLTIDTRSAGAGHKALVLDNMLECVVENVYLNGTGAAGSGVQLIGGGAKSTYFNRFNNVHITAGVACVDLGDLCNGNSWVGGVLEGTGIAVRCNPAAETTDTCKFIDVAIQASNARIVELGTGLAACTNFEFIACRFERSVDVDFYLGAQASKHCVLGGSWTHILINDNGVENTFLIPNSGIHRLGRVNATAAKRTLDLRQATAGITVGNDDLCNWYRAGAGRIRSDAAIESLLSLQTYRGGVTSMVMNDSGIMAAGSAAAQNLFVDSKGTGQVQLNTQNGATGGTKIEAAAGKVGFYGTTPIAKQTGVAVTAAGIHAALVALGIIAA